MITSNNEEGHLHNQLTWQQFLNKVPRNVPPLSILVSQCYFFSPICLNKNEINVVVVNKSVSVDFPSIVMSKFARLRAIRVPFV